MTETVNKDVETSNTKNNTTTTKNNSQCSTHNTRQSVSTKRGDRESVEGRRRDDRQRDGRKKKLSSITTTLIIVSVLFLVLTVPQGVYIALSSFFPKVRITLKLTMFYFFFSGPFLFVGYSFFLRLWSLIYSIFFNHLFGVDLPVYCSSHSPIFRNIFFKVLTVFFLTFWNLVHS